MKRVQLETKISIDAKIGEKSVDEYLREIADCCHEGLEDSTCQQSETVKCLENEDYASALRILENRVSILEGVLCTILEILDD